MPAPLFPEVVDTIRRTGLLAYNGYAMSPLELPSRCAPMATQNISGRIDPWGMTRYVQLRAQLRLLRNTFIRRVNTVKRGFGPDSLRCREPLPGIASVERLTKSERQVTPPSLSASRT